MFRPELQEDLRSSPSSFGVIGRTPAAKRGMDLSCTSGLFSVTAHQLVQCFGVVIVCLELAPNAHLSPEAQEEGNKTTAYVLSLLDRRKYGSLKLWPIVPGRRGVQLVQVGDSDNSAKIQGQKTT
jgi:hypothetical protein